MAVVTDDLLLTRLQTRLEAERETAAMAAFLRRAKRWWAAYVAVREGLRGRPVRVFARDEGGCQRPVCSFLQPMPTRLLPTARDAARFVALLPLAEAQGGGAALPLHGGVGGGGSSGGEASWRSWPSVFSCGSASREEKALLLCSLLLGLGLDAYVCVGRDSLRPQVWVLTRDVRQRPMLWAPCTGCRYGGGGEGEGGGSPLLDCPYVSIGCAFNHLAVWAATAANDAAVAMRYELEDEAFWSRLNAAEPGEGEGGEGGDSAAALMRRPMCPLLPPSRVVPHVEEARGGGRGARGSGRGGCTDGLPAADWRRGG